MKKILLLIFIVNCSVMFAQLGVKLSYIRPTGDLGASMKPTVGAELIYKPFKGDDIGDNTGFNIRASIGFAKFEPRKDTFPTYGVISGQGTTVTPGYTVIHKYNIANLSLGADYVFGLSDKLFLYPGMDVGALFTIVDYESHTPMISDEGYSGGYTYISIRLRLGAEYFIKERISVFGEFTRSMNFSPETGGLAYNDYGIGARIKF